MAKLKTFYVCQNCSTTVSQWVGQCPNCGQWNTLVEEVQAVNSPSKGGNNQKLTVSFKIQKLSEIIAAPPKRLSSGISEFDRVLGGGFVPGQVILLGGEPGVGKSTLLTEIARKLAPKNVLYVCGEESMDQIKIRTLRMGYEANNLLMFPQVDVDSICSAIETSKDVDLVVVDSIQTLVSADIPGSAGSMTQVRGCTQLLTTTAKAVGIPVVLIGHVTKEGVVAGPKVLEHMVDTVLYLEGDAQHMYRLLRTEKNRFGPVSEVGIFELTEKSMQEVANPSELFLSQTLKNAPGSCVTVVMEGQRPLLFEVQALTVKTSFGYPRRTTSGYNVNRLQLLIAILEKRCNLNLGSYDVYVNVAGGFKISEYAADLAVCAAIASSLKDKPIKPKTIVFGECGLSGEVRRVTHHERRIKEAKKMGFTNVISAENTRSIKEILELLI